MAKFEFEIDGVIYSTSPITSADFEDIEGIGEEVEIDPDSWRQYSDIINDAQLEWLKKHPEHDHTNAVARYSKASD